jgi:pimeloyl-ACP methyl ester carboxylesterase
MPLIKVGTENRNDIELHYNDHGAGEPIVLVDGYPLDGTSWERRERVLLAERYRCITHDRRGFGHSSRPSTGCDYDAFAADLKALLAHIALDQEVVLAGFSLGAGEVTRYLGTDGSAGISKAVLIGSLPRYMLQADDNPKGAPSFEGLKQASVADRYAFFDSFLATSTTRT